MESQEGNFKNSLCQFIYKKLADFPICSPKECIAADIAEPTGEVLQ
jgi:hypothetical protein